MSQLCGRMPGPHPGVGRGVTVQGCASIGGLSGALSQSWGPHTSVAWPVPTVPRQWPDGATDARQPASSCDLGACVVVAWSIQHGGASMRCPVHIFRGSSEPGLAFFCPEETRLRSVRCSRHLSRG